MKKRRATYQLIFSQEEINQLHNLSLAGLLDIVRARILIAYYHLLDYGEMIYARMDESFVREGEVVHIGVPALNRRARRIPLHPITRPIFEKYNNNIPRVEFMEFKKSFKTLVQLAGIKGSVRKGSKEKTVTPEKLEQLVTLWAVSNSAAFNLMEQTNDTRLLETLLKMTGDKDEDFQPYSFEELKETYFSQPIRGWKATKG